MCKMQCVNGSASLASWMNQLDRPAGQTSWTDQLDGSVRCILSLGQFAYSKISFQFVHCRSFRVRRRPCLSNETFLDFDIVKRSWIFWAILQAKMFKYWNWNEVKWNFLGFWRSWIMKCQVSGGILHSLSPKWLKTDWSTLIHYFLIQFSYYVEHITPDSLVNVTRVKNLSWCFLDVWN